MSATAVSSEAQPECVLGDSADGLASLAESSVDALVTDPPAGIGFMGKDWDSDKGGRVSWVAWFESVARECLRVMKPGAHGVVWALPRTSHWTATALEQAGFEVRDVITHHFGTGFPKSLNVSKAIDKRGGNAHLAKRIGSALREARELRGVTAVEADRLFCGGTSLYSWFEGRPAGQHIPTADTFAKIVQAWPEISSLAADVAEAERVVIGSEQVSGVGLPFAHDGKEHTERLITSNSTDAAKQWEGWGTALKPASEHWILIRKPLSGTVAANVQEHGTGALNIDATRIGGEERPIMERTTTVVGASSMSGVSTGATPSGQVTNLGRWPANLVLSHTEWCDEGGCLPGCPVALLDAQSGPAQSGAMKQSTIRRGTNEVYGKFTPGSAATAREIQASTGGASRFFYVSKPTTGEREENIRDLPRRSAGELVDRDEGSAGMSNPRAGAGRTSRGRANVHPTVKSIALMSWLIKLVAPPGGLVLDPFAGSGSTGVAALRLGYRFAGWERDPEYHRIATARIERALRGMQMGLPL